MNNFDFQKEGNHYFRRGVTCKLISYVESNQLSNAESQTPTWNTEEQVGLDFSPLAEKQDVPRESSHQVEDYSLPIDISSALKSIGLTQILGSKLSSRMPLLVSGPQEDDSTLSPLDQRDKMREDASDEELLHHSYKSKYARFFPLYQDYCLKAVRENMLRFKDGCLSEFTNPQFLQSLQSPTGLESPQSQSPVLRSPQPIRVTSCTLWQDLDEVKESGLLSSLTVKEIRLQESIFELIGSEASYVKSLKVAEKHFYASKALKTILTKRDHQVLFSNLHQVKTASERFLMDLETHLGENVLMPQVGDIVLKHSREFHKLYVPYVTNMTYQESLINKLLQQNKNFFQTLKELERDPACQRQTLKSFLVLPLQRITRMKLLLETILKLTNPHTESVSNIKKAIDAIHEMVTKCDEGVRKMKQLEELASLVPLFDFSNIKSVPLVTSTRHLVLQGPMKQLTTQSSYNSGTSFLDIYIHLFNDLLIISSKRYQRFVVVDHALFPTQVSVGTLKPEVLGLPRFAFLLHLSERRTGNPTALILDALTRSDKEEWMKALSSKE